MEAASLQKRKTWLSELCWVSLQPPSFVCAKGVQADIPMPNLIFVPCFHSTHSCLQESFPPGKDYCCMALQVKESFCFGLDTQCICRGWIALLSSFRLGGLRTMGNTSFFTCETDFSLWAEEWSSGVTHVLSPCVSRHRKDFTGQSCGHGVQNHLL